MAVQRALLLFQRADFALQNSNSVGIGHRVKPGKFCPLARKVALHLGKLPLQRADGLIPLRAQ